MVRLLFVVEKEVINSTMSYYQEYKASFVSGEPGTKQRRLLSFVSGEPGTKTRFILYQEYFAPFVRKHVLSFVSGEPCTSGRVMIEI